MPLHEWLKEIPRLFARAVYFALPLWLTYSATKTVTVANSVPPAQMQVPLYSYRWPFWALLLCYCLVGSYKLFRSTEGELLNQRRFLAKSTAGSLQQIQEAILKCPNRDSLEMIQTGLLSVIVDKAKELLSVRDDVFCSNLMVADEVNKVLRLKMFSRHANNRQKIDLAFGTPGAGRAIVEMKPVYIPDIQTEALKGHFRDDAPYRSVLSIPVACKHRRLGVINLDSSQVDHFWMTWLADHLQPYVQLIGLTLCLEANHV